MGNLVKDIIAPKSELKLHIGLFFGTYNPIHIGHMAIANYLVEFTEIDELWFVISPHSPEKKRNNLLQDYHRLELVHRAIDDDPRFRVSSVEFKLPKPSYTIDTLAYLGEQFPNHRFSIIMGSDNLESFHKWKNHEAINTNYGIIVYPRPGFKQEKVKSFKNVIIAQAPLIEISSTFIRKAIRDGKNVSQFLPKKTWEYIEEMNFYRK